MELDKGNIAGWGIRRVFSTTLNKHIYGTTWRAAIYALRNLVGACHVIALKSTSNAHVEVGSDSRSSFVGSQLDGGKLHAHLVAFWLSYQFS